MKTALLVVSFGTTHLDTMDKTITATERALAAAFPELPFYRAFTSGTVRKRLAAKYDIHVDSIEEAFVRIRADGFDRVIVQPTLLIPGEEYSKMCDTIAHAAGAMEFQIGRPLLCDDEDLDSIIQILRSAYPVAEDTVLLLMGHGTEHQANEIYLRMNRKMRQLTDTAMRICTVEGTPSFADAVKELSAMPQRKVRLVPLLFVAGDHAANDMAGESPDSLRSILKENGYSVDCVLQGLGQLDAIQAAYTKRAAEAADRLRIENIWNA